MPIHYTLHPSKLTGQYMAVVNFTGSMDEEGVIDQMMRQGSTLTRSDTLAALENYHQAIITLVLEGFKVRTRTAVYGASIKGSFEGQDDAFSPARHRLEPQVSAGSALRHAMHREGRAVKGESRSQDPHPLEYTDVNSGSRNDQITPGGLGQLSGYRLKFDPADPAQGLFFVGADSQSTRVEVIGHNHPKSLSFLVPASLGPGVYTLLVRAVIRGKLRQGELLSDLTVL